MHSYRSQCKLNEQRIFHHQDFTIETLSKEIELIDELKSISDNKRVGTTIKTPEKISKDTKVRGFEEEMQNYIDSIKCSKRPPSYVIPPAIRPVEIE